MHAVPPTSRSTAGAEPGSAQLLPGPLHQTSGGMLAHSEHHCHQACVSHHQLIISLMSRLCQLWCSKYLTLAGKVLFFRTTVLSILLYGCETWLALETHTQRLEVFQMNCLRYLCGFAWHDHRTNVSVRHSCQLPSIASEVWFRRLRWLGHVARMPYERLPIQVQFGQLSRPGAKGRPKQLADSYAKGLIYSPRLS